MVAERSDEGQTSMVDPASVADWAQASFITGLVAGLAAMGMRALTQEQREPSMAPTPNTQAAATTGRR
jgi:hypothetical protein